MWSSFVVATTALLDYDPGLRQASKDFCVQTLVAEGAVENLVATVLAKLARFDVRQLNVVLAHLLLQGLGKYFALSWRASVAQ